MARKLGIDPAIIANEKDPWTNAARLAAAIIYQEADDKAEAEAKAASQSRK